jgi:hypothetical protein
MGSMFLDGGLPILLLIVLIYSGFVFDVAARIVSRCKRYSLRSLLIALTVASLLLGVTPTVFAFIPLELVLLGGVLAITMFFIANIVRELASP